MNDEVKPKPFTNLKIGWIGTGKMGLPMGRNLQKSGFTVLAYDSDPIRLARSGLKPVESLKALSLEADILVSMIPNDEVLREIVLGKDGVRSALRPGKLFVDLSTVSPSASAECAEALERNSIEYIRGAVSGSTELAEKALLTVILSGRSDAIERCRPMFAAFGNKLYVVGAKEEARYLKLLINTMVAATAAMCAEALALGEKGGIEWNRMLDVLSDSVVASPLIKYKVALLRKRDYTPAFTCEQMLKDLSLARDAAQGCGISLPLLSEVNHLFERAAAAGDGELDFFAVLRSVEQSAAIEPSAE
jgi:3-hydroxyisobutyrate dehydrogenase-like beta-hydroxyacid dehydrogenase